MFFDERDEIGRRVACERGPAEMRIIGEKIFWLAIEIGEVAPPAAGDQYLLADPLRALEHQHATAALARLDGTNEPSGAGAEHNDIKLLGCGQEPSYSQAPLLPLRARISERNSCRVFSSLRKAPSIEEVTAAECCFSTPRIIMQRWRASTTTPTPSGAIACWMLSAICIVNRSCT